MHKIISSDVVRGERPFIGEDEIRITGHVISIEPPIDLNPDVVEKALSKGNIGNPQFDSKENPFSAITLIGSTDTRTVIYGRLFRDALTSIDANQNRTLLVERARELLGVLGINGVEHNHEVAPMSKILL